MSATSVGLIYSATTWRLRSVVIPDNNSELSFRRLGLGEAMRTISIASYNSPTDLQATLNALTGHIPSGDRYINVDAGNNVVSVHLADPNGCGDKSPQSGGTLIAHASAQQNDLYWGGAVISPRPVSPSGSVLPGTLIDQHARLHAANQQTPQI